MIRFPTSYFSFRRRKKKPITEFGSMIETNYYFNIMQGIGYACDRFRNFYLFFGAKCEETYSSWIIPSAFRFQFSIIMFLFSHSNSTFHLIIVAFTMRQSIAECDDFLTKAHMQLRQRNYAIDKNKCDGKQKMSAKQRNMHWKCIIIFYCGA